MEAWLREWLFSEAGRSEGAYWVRVVGAKGSTPRKAGASMLVRSDGQVLGTIGGGAVEHQAWKRVAELRASGGFERQHIHLGQELAMCCGGQMELWLSPLKSSEADVLRSAWAAVVQAKAPVVETTWLDSGPSSRVRTELGAVGRAVDKPALDPDGKTFRWPLEQVPRAVLVGGGHIHQALAELLPPLGFSVVVCDDSENDAVEAAWDAAVPHVPSFQLADFEQAHGVLGAGDYLSVATRDHALDEDVLRQALGRSPCAFIGLVSSRAKWARIQKRLLARNPEFSDRIAEVRAPVGLEIGAQTPAEIALSMAAQLVAVRRGKGRRRPS